MGPVLNWLISKYEVGLLKLRGPPKIPEGLDRDLLAEYQRNRELPMTNWKELETARIWAEKELELRKANALLIGDDTTEDAKRLYREADLKEKMVASVKNQQDEHTRVVDYMITLQQWEELSHGR